MAKIPGHSRLQTNGILSVKTPYIRIPYKLLKSDDFYDLSPYAVKLYLILLKDWATHDPDKAVVVSYTKLCRLMKTGSKQVSNAMKQLMVNGYIYKETGYKRCNRYYIEQKRFTGEY